MENNKEQLDRIEKSIIGMGIYVIFAILVCTVSILLYLK